MLLPILIVAALVLLTLDLIATTYLLSIVLKRAGYPIPGLRKKEPARPYTA